MLNALLPRPHRPPADTVAPVTAALLQSERAAVTSRRDADAERGRQAGLGAARVVYSTGGAHAVYARAPSPSRHERGPTRSSTPKTGRQHERRRTVKVKLTRRAGHRRRYAHVAPTLPVGKHLRCPATRATDAGSASTGANLKLRDLLDEGAGQSHTFRSKTSRQRSARPWPP